jgi:hypothetical protein
MLKLQDAKRFIRAGARGPRAKRGGDEENVGRFGPLDPRLEVHNLHPQCPRRGMESPRGQLIQQSVLFRRFVFVDRFG